MHRTLSCVRRRRRVPVVISGVLIFFAIQLYLALTLFKIEPELSLNCTINSSDALSALNRVRSRDCSRLIRNAVCKHHDNQLLPTELHGNCSLREDVRFISCFGDDGKLSAINIQHNNMTQTLCQRFCYQSGHIFAALKSGDHCFCGDTLPSSSVFTCNIKCFGDPENTCGGSNSLEVYTSGVGSLYKEFNPSVLPPLPKTKPNTKILFILTLNGRAHRQVLRLLNVLYDAHHWFYIHIDERQSFLYHTIKKTLGHLDNVVFARERRRTIWGGASLLDVLLTALQEMDNFKYDYAINLSETDFPIKSVSSLMEFLTVYNGTSFIRGQVSNVPRFIQKQGLERLFVECDGHMWRIGSRSLPSNLLINGGSDWLMLHRDFVHYILHSDSHLVHGLKDFYKYTLLPAESFFHTLIINSPYCDRHVNNNLRLTNWDRRRGCKCQYRHVVDWCGCSPNVITVEHKEKLQITLNRPIFFARKFDPTVSLSMIDMAEFMVTGQRVITRSFWQNECHYNYECPQVLMVLANDVVQRVYDCQGEHYAVQEVNSLWQADRFAALVIRYTVTLRTGRQVVMEAKAQDVDQPVTWNRGVNTRLKSAGLGNTWDPKEEIFRSLPKVLSAENDITLALTWAQGQPCKVMVIFLDPTDEIAASYDIEVGEQGHSMSLNTNLTKPIRGGRWTVKILYKWSLVMQLTCVVIGSTEWTGVYPSLNNLRSLIGVGPIKSPNPVNLTEVYSVTDSCGCTTQCTRADWSSTVTSHYVFT